MIDGADCRARWKISLRFCSDSPTQRLFRTESRSEEHTSELQSRVDLVCRLLLEKKNTIANRRSAGLASQVSIATGRPPRQRRRAPRAHARRVARSGGVCVRGGGPALPAFVPRSI